EGGLGRNACRAGVSIIVGDLRPTYEHGGQLSVGFVERRIVAGFKPLDGTTLIFDGGGDGCDVGHVWPFQSMAASVSGTPRRCATLRKLELMLRTSTLAEVARRCAKMSARSEWRTI